MTESTGMSGEVTEGPGTGCIVGITGGVMREDSCLGGKSTLLIPVEAVGVDGSETT